MLPKLTFQALGQSNSRTAAPTSTGCRAILPRSTNTSADPLCGWDASVSLWRDVFGFVFTGADDSNFSSVRKDLPVNLVGGENDPATDGGKAVGAACRPHARGWVFRIWFQRFTPQTRHECLNELNRDIDHCTISSPGPEASLHAMIRDKPLVSCKSRDSAMRYLLQRCRRLEYCGVKWPNLPLKGVRVIELARVLAGPWAGQMLADLGADVIKVENPSGGDETRGWGPPFITSSEGENLSAAYFHSCNRGKRSITSTLRQRRDRKPSRLCRTADVVLENFKVGGLKKYGLDYAILSAAIPVSSIARSPASGRTVPTPRRRAMTSSFRACRD